MSVLNKDSSKYRLAYLLTYTKHIRYFSTKYTFLLLLLMLVEKTLD